RPAAVAGPGSAPARPVPQLLLRWLSLQWLVLQWLVLRWPAHRCGRALRYRASRCPALDRPALWPVLGSALLRRLLPRWLLPPRMLRLGLPLRAAFLRPLPASPRRAPGPAPRRRWRPQRPRRPRGRTTPAPRPCVRPPAACRRTRT